MIPSNRALALLGLCSLLLVSGFVTPALSWVGLALDALILGLVVADGRRASRVDLRFERHLPLLFHQGEAATVTVEVEARGAQARLWLREVLEPGLLDQVQEARFLVPPGGRASWTLPVLPMRRGRLVLAPLAVRVQGPWRLAWHGREVLHGQEVKVYPRAHFEGPTGLLLRQTRDRRAGAHTLLARGLSSELYALREYQAGDEIRNLHWKAAARQGRPITRENTWEQNQDLVVLLDCGRPMAALDGVFTKLDHALAAVLALLQVVVAHHDAATLVLFSGSLRCMVRVDAHTRSFGPVFEQVYAQQADGEEPDYGAMAALCSQRVPRRSLAILCTSVMDLVASDELARAMTALATRHRTLLVNLEDAALVRRHQGVPETVEDAFAKVSAMEMVRSNQELGAHLRARGVDVLGVAASGLTFQLVRRYLDLKARRAA